MSKTVRIVIITGVILVALAVLMMRGQRAWNISALAAYKAELRAKGEKLTASELGYPRPPESGQSLNQLQARLSHIGALKYHPGSLELMRFVGAGCVQIAWATARPPCNFTQGPGTNSPGWGEFCSELESIGTTLAEVRAATQNPPRYFYNDPSNFTNRAMGPFVTLRNAAQWLMGDTIAALHSDQLERARADLHALVQLAQFYREDLTLVSQMIRAAIAGLGMQVTWEALQAPGWNEEQLVAMQRNWEELDLTDALERGIAGERASGAAAMAYMRTLTSRERVDFWRSGSQTTSPTAGESLEQLALMALWIPNSEADELFALKFHQSSLEASRSLRAGTPMVEINRQFQTNAAQLAAIIGTPLGRYRYFHSAVSIPNFTRAAQKCVRNETQRRLTITAIALERHRLRNGKLPEELDALMPQFLSTVPIDPMSGQPLRYRLNADGGFTLYSAGEDGRDDGGDPNSATSTNKFGLWEGKDAVWPTAVR